MRRASGLTDNEGALLALILRAEPVTPYQIGKLYASPIYNFNTAKGKLYPLIRRLEGHGLISSMDVANDRRGTHRFSCTAAGRDALKSWLCSFRPEHALLPDPLRKKLQAIDLLSPEEQLRWLDDARSQIKAKLETVGSYDPASEGRLGALAQDSAIESLKGRLRWLDRLERVLRG